MTIILNIPSQQFEINQVLKYTEVKMTHLDSTFMLEFDTFLALHQEGLIDFWSYLGVCLFVLFFHVQALSVGIFPYVLKLLQSSARELRPLLVFIWAKILAVDRVRRIMDMTGGYSPLPCITY